MQKSTWGSHDHCWHLLKQYPISISEIWCSYSITALLLIHSERPRAAHTWPENLFHNRMRMVEAGLNDQLWETMGLACEAVWREVCTWDSLFSHHHIVTTQPELSEHSGPSHSMLKHGTRFAAATARGKNLKHGMHCWPTPRVESRWAAWPLLAFTPAAPRCNSDLSWWLPPPPQLTF